MKTKIKKLIPQPIKDILRPLKKKFYDDAKKRVLFKKMQKKHKQLIEQIKGKEKIKVVFLAIHKSVWKVDPVFKKMLDDPYFEPIILVCPYTAYGEERMWEDMKDTYEYFEDKGYPLLSSYNKDEDRWISLEEIKPDIVFFTNPHDLTRKEYYEDAYMNYLSCYAGYGMPISKYDNFEDQFNKFFHNCVWKIFVQTQEMLINYQNISQRANDGIQLVGDCLVENLRNKSVLYTNCWKNDNDKLKLIYAPHHTIEENNSFSISTFLQNGEYIKELVTDYRDYIYWSFKPHPILKSKLYAHLNWGKDKTDKYYNFWKNFGNSQIDEGEYIDLFKYSDAMILDSSSFLGEYLFIDKPMLYLMKKETNNYMSEFGTDCLKVCELAYKNEEIRQFINNLISKKDQKSLVRKNLIKDYDKSLSLEKDTSSEIIKEIKNIGL